MHESGALRCRSEPAYDPKSTQTLFRLSPVWTLGVLLSLSIYGPKKIGQLDSSKNRYGAILREASQSLFWHYGALPSPRPASIIALIFALAYLA